MKKALFTLTILIILFSIKFTQAQTTNNKELGLPGDNFNLALVLEKFQQCKTLEEFEKEINKEENKINNLDLNTNDSIDYIKVVDNVEGNSHAIALQALINVNEIQDVAVIMVDKNVKGEVTVQIIGDKELYGKDYILEPTPDAKKQEPTKPAQTSTPNPGYKPSTSDTIKSADGTTVINNNYYSTNNNTTNSTTNTTSNTAPQSAAYAAPVVWPLWAFLFAPMYVPYYSPYGYGYYPAYYRPYQPVGFTIYVGYHPNYYNNNYHHCNNYNNVSHHNNYQNNSRHTSNTVVINNTNNTYNNNRNRPSNNNNNRPSNNNNTRPSTGGNQPSQRPAGGGNSPSLRPNSGSTPSTMPANKPSYQPAPNSRPNQPQSRPSPSQRPSQPQSRPSGGGGGGRRR